MGKFIFTLSQWYWTYNKYLPHCIATGVFVCKSTAARTLTFFVRNLKRMVWNLWKIFLIFIPEISYFHNFELKLAGNFVFVESCGERNRWIIQEKDEEFETTKKNFQRTLDSMQVMFLREKIQGPTSCGPGLHAGNVSKGADPGPYFLRAWTPFR